MSHIMITIGVLSSQVTPKNPSLHMQTKASTLASMQVPPFSQGKLEHDSHGSEINSQNKCKN